ncbi:MAG: hypothetical protein K2L21_06620 [Muribaculaceae bacterium]|nr:hypothetical protein [Muribaculaceae bacterium]
MKNKHLRYTSPTDKSYGVAGMAIAVVAYDAQDALAAVTIDTDGGTADAISFHPGFHYIPNQRMSAKTAWNEIIAETRLTAGMIVANAMSRSYVQHRRLLSEAVTSALAEALAEACDSEDNPLERDELDAMLRSNIDFFDHLFQISAVHSATHALAQDLATRHTLSPADILDHLAPIVRYL